MDSIFVVDDSYFNFSEYPQVLRYLVIWVLAFRMPFLIKLIVHVQL